ncbi:MAG: hypothetical protein N2C14_15810, partial [Planctomycetales bacterium]
MMISSDGSDSRWTRTCVLLGAMVVLPLGAIHAQDYDAVGKRLRAAVEAKEISPEQARAMIKALKDSNRSGKKHEGSKSRKIDKSGEINWDALKNKIEGAVKRGDLTRQEADAKYAAFKQHHEAHAKVDKHAKSHPGSKNPKVDKHAKHVKSSDGSKNPKVDKHAKSHPGTKHVKSHEGSKNPKMDWDGIKRKIETAVKRG